MRESTHGGDETCRRVIFSGGVILNQFSVFHGVSSSHYVDLLVYLSSVITVNWILTILPRQLLGMQSAGDTLESMVSGKVNFVSNRPTMM